MSINIDEMPKLGFGLMRLPEKDGTLDIEEIKYLVDRFMEKGFTYYDTAYIYPGSEAALGEILERNKIRDQVYIATKLPHYLIKNRESMEKYFVEH